jgi:NurA-like 5'-3' nuclease
METATQQYTDEVVQRIKMLNKKIIDGLASDSEKNEYIELLHQTNSLSEKLYEKYKRKEFIETILKTALIVGGIFVLGAILSKKAE